MEWWKLLSTLLVGVLLGFLSSYPVGFLRELGRARAAQVTVTRQKKAEANAAALRQAAAVAAAEAKAAGEQAELKALETARVGARFLRRVTSSDAGLLLEVVGLDPRRPRDHVLVTQEPLPGRVPTPHDPVGGQSSMAWRQLNEAPADQIHKTARLVNQSYDDADGWIEFERIPDR
ncbi:MAG: hypothetical protein Q7V57_18515 [Actinomycetota bacterium]|nr:hypothetical protein [Actinomycetota bacterium]